MLLMVVKGIRGGNKYIKNYNKNKEPPYTEYLDANNLCG